MVDAGIVRKMQSDIPRPVQALIDFWKQPGQKNINTLLAIEHRLEAACISWRYTKQGIAWTNDWTMEKGYEPRNRAEIVRQRKAVG